MFPLMAVEPNSRITELVRKIRLTRFGQMARATVFPQDLVTSKREFIFLYAVRLLHIVSRRLWLDQMPQHAAALSFLTLLGIVPFFAVIVAIATSLGFDWYVDEILVFLEANLLPDAARAVGGRLLSVIDGIKPAPLASVGSITLFALVLMLLTNVENAVNSIFRCKTKRNILERVVRTVLIMLIVPPALGTSLYLTRQMVTLPIILSFVYPLLFTVTALFASYTFLPRRKVTIRYALIAAVFAGIGFELLKYGFALYAQRVGVTLSNAYGTFAMVPIFLVWIYTAWMSFLFGAELSAALHEVGDREHLEAS